MATPVEELCAFSITEALELAKKEFEEYLRIEAAHGDSADEFPSIVHQRALGPRLTVHGWYRIILHEEVRIKALKRQVNRLIAANTIEGDDVPYSDDECWPEEEPHG